MDDEGLVHIRVVSVPDTREAKLLLRAILGPQEIIDAIRRHDENRTPVVIGQLFGLDHDDVAQDVLRTLDGLDRAGAMYKLIVEGEEESREYLLNRLEQWAEINQQLRREDDARFGE